MREFVDVTGKTEDEAISRALEQLRLERDDVSVEILERAKSGFLGLGGCPAKVRVYYGPEEEDSLPSAPAEEKEAEPVATPVQPKAAPVHRVPKKKETTAEPKEETAQNPEAETETAALLPEADDEKAQEIRVFLSGLLQQMDHEAKIHIQQPEKGRYQVFLEGQNMGALIGRRGETLDAIQQLTSYCVNRTGSRVRIQLDTENYRAKREQSLEHLAKKVAAKVVKYHRSVTLEPMNAYERHVIHTALQDMENVITYSTGVDPNRRVIVAFDRSKH